MTSTVIAHYETKSGESAIKLVKYTSVKGSVSYGYKGKFGAGCTSVYTEAVERVYEALKNRRNISLVAGVDVRTTSSNALQEQLTAARLAVNAETFGTSKFDAAFEVCKELARQVDAAKPSEEFCSVDSGMHRTRQLSGKIV